MIKKNSVNFLKQSMKRIHFMGNVEQNKRLNMELIREKKLL